MHNCPVCKEKISASDKFCSCCGFRIYVDVLEYVSLCPLNEKYKQEFASYVKEFSEIKEQILSPDADENNIKIDDKFFCGTKDDISENSSVSELEYDCNEEEIRDVTKTLLPIMVDTEDTTYVWGNPHLQRESIKEITFLNTIAEIPGGAWDISVSGDGSVLAWTREKGKSVELIVAGEGGVQAPSNSSYLFSSYTNLNKINFNECFDTSHVEYMYSMFADCINLKTVDIREFDTMQVKDMGWMFGHCVSLASVNMSGCNTSKVTNMGGIFDGCFSLVSVDMKGINTAQVRNMEWMFGNCIKLVSVDVSGFDTRQVVNMNSMFRGCRALKNVDVSKFDTSQVTNMNYMFFKCSSLNNDPGTHFFDFSKTKTRKKFCTDAGWTREVIQSPNDGKADSDTQVVETSGVILQDATLQDDVTLKEREQCEKDGTKHELKSELKIRFRLTKQITVALLIVGLICIEGIILNFINIEKRTSVTMMSTEDTEYVWGNKFLKRDSIEEITFLDTIVGAPDNAWDISKESNGKVLAWTIENGEYKKLFVAGEGGVQAPQDSSQLFASFDNVHKVSFNACFDTSGVTDMSMMFACCSNLTEVDVSRFNTSKVTDMSWMFSGCSSLSSIDVNKFNTSKVTNMSYMFYYCQNIKNDPGTGSFDFSKVKYLESFSDGAGWTSN